MLALEDQVVAGSGVNRRQFLRMGGLSLGGLGLADLVRLKALAGEQGRRDPLRNRSVIFLFMQGGPSQFETFDPKMEAPSGIRSTTGEIRTTIPGITFGSHLSKLARLAHKFSIVRSFATGSPDHDLKPIVSKETLRANLGSLYARVAGAMRPGTAMPSNVALHPRSVMPEAGPMITEFGDLTSHGGLGRVYSPFVVGSGEGAQEDMTLNLPQLRVNSRRDLLAAMDTWKRWADMPGAPETLGRFQQQAFETLLKGVAAAFDLSREDPRVLARYDTSVVVPAERISRKWNNHKHYGDHAATLGRLLLLARRLCEHGCGFVTVTTSFVWDMHADINNAPMPEGMDYVGTPFDHAVSAFIEDVENRGLSDKILLVCCGEMGRTPQVNAAGGRDHWGQLSPLMLYGGGLQMGQVIGGSSRDGGEPSSQPIGIEDLVATIMHVLLDLGEVRSMAGLPQNLLQALSAGTPIRGLV